MCAAMESDLIEKIGAIELTRLAQSYVWWKPVPEVIANPSELIPRIMDMGDWGDVQLIANKLGEAPFHRAIEQAVIGQFSPRSWHYWHYRLGLARAGQVPPLPANRFSSP